jgi:glycosyltransferase involved in cell wall biosynthesis
VLNLTRHRGEDGGGIYYPKNAWQVIRLLLRLNYEVIHLHVGGDLSLRHAAVMLVCSLLPGKKTVFTFHSGGYPSSEAGRRARPLSLRGFALRRLAGLIAVNQELVDLFRRFGVDSGKIRLILPFGSVRLPERPLPEPLAAFYRAHDPVLLTVGLLEPEYDLPLQVKALGKIREQFPGAGLVIVGSGSLEAAIRQLIAEQPWREHILLTGDLAHEATLRAIAASRVLLRTTLYDGDSVSVREALQLGTPVIATDNGMRPEGVHLVPVSDEAALCRAVQTVLQLEPSVGAKSESSGSENLDAIFRLYEDVCSKTLPRAVARIQSNRRSAAG